MRQMKYWLCACLVLLSFPLLAHAEQQDATDEQVKSIEDSVENLLQLDGFFNLYWDEKKGRLLLRIDAMGEEFIYQSSMPRGVGSNDLGLDRGQLGSTKLVEFSRSGPKILLIQKNTHYRANSDDPLERAAVESSFARSVIWGFERVAESGDSVLVDATEFFLHDSHGLATRLNRRQQGSYKIDPSRSAVYLPHTRAFPDNTEVEAIVSYTGERKFNDKGAVVSDILSTVVPDPTSVSVHLHHSFIRLPDDNYEPLTFDSRAGIIGSSWGAGFADYASPIGAPLKGHFGMRHRLEKLHPEAPVSEAVEPIIYYLDPAVPEPVRSALLEGAGWWNQAFEAAGYKDAFQVKLLPPGADPMDVRYNVIQWVHRSTRGWSYGYSVVDPRTSEILKGHVSLGSLRVRQDYLIAEGLLAPYQNGKVPDEMLEMSLARIRQLSAHEVGHTIGMEHNFAASVNNRSSVMDYPFPLIKFNADGSLDLSEAYDVGIGEWDKRTVLYAYQDFPTDQDGVLGRQKILKETMDSGLLYVADADAGDPGSAHPNGNLWDNGADAIEEFNHLLRVRSYALSNFSENNIRPGRPLATIEEVLVPIYLLHRFQIQAVGKLIGGQYFSYNMRGDGQSLPVNVDAKEQQSAINALIASIEPEVLMLPQSIVDIVLPRPPGFGRDRESFARTTGTTLDPLSPAASAISLTLDVMMNRKRAARMNAFHAVDTSQPNFSSVLNALTQVGWYEQRQTAMRGAIQRITGDQLLNRLMTLAMDTTVNTQVRAQAFFSIQELDQWLAKQNASRLDSDWAAHYAMARHEIAAMMSDPSRMKPSGSYSTPPGSPIGN